jgi:acetylornithine deacetylase/succinyl-diaminopimelate desuccinylase-like protein
VRDLRAKYPDYGLEYEVFVTAPGSEISERHPLIGAIDAGHERVFGELPARDTVRWFSDASALTRYGIESVNYGTSSGLPGPDGESLDIEGLVKIATVYALAMARICEPVS